MPINPQEMMRQLHAYAMAEMRNRGLEEGAKTLELYSGRFVGRDHYEAQRIVQRIRALKTDPSENLTDWWSPQGEESTLQQTPGA
ncbi:MAG: hypothetical protein JWR80_10004 [Bradyrhizobium sp.]|nr:hypothetical protein [Bradyrhizobium sp.]